jgi:hypothetical protein
MFSMSDSTSRLRGSPFSSLNKGEEHQLIYLNLFYYYYDLFAFSCYRRLSGNRSEGPENDRERDDRLRMDLSRLSYMYYPLNLNREYRDHHLDSAGPCLAKSITAT